MKITMYFAMLVFVMLFVTNIDAADIKKENQKMVVIPEAIYKAILKRIDTLQKRLEKLEAKKNTQKKTIMHKEEVTREEIEEIYDTLDRLETKAIKDRLNWGAEIRTRMDNFYFKGANYQTGRRIKDHNNNHWSCRFRLNMSAKLSENLIFHGRLSVTKNWADNDAQLNYMDFNRGHTPGGSTNVQFERAYVDWIVPNFPIPLAITFGRHPSTEGPPVEFKENRVRQSTYPALIFDGEADGIVVTLGLERYLGLKSSALRLCYGKGFQDDDDRYNYLDSSSGVDDTNFLAFFFESQIPKISKSLLILSYVRAFDMIDNPLGPQKNIGDMDLFGIHLQAENIIKKGLNLFLSTGLNRSHPDGTTFINSPAGRINVGLLTNDGKERKTGWSIYTGVRYTLPLPALKNPKLGFEYNHGSKYWFTFTQSSIELYNKLATRGNVFDFYYIQPLNKHLFLRLGYTYLDYEYTGSGMHLGAPKRSHDSLRNIYMLLDCRF